MRHIIRNFIRNRADGAIRKFIASKIKPIIRLALIALIVCVVIIAIKLLI